MRAAVIILALVLLILHPWAILAVLALELAALAVIGAGIARAAGWTPRIVARWSA